MEKDIINYENYDGYKTLLKLKENEPGTKYKKKRLFLIILLYGILLFFR